MDELGQFPGKAVDGLREALEDGCIMVGRVEGERVPLPAKFQLVAATNPCPCGGGGEPGACECDERARQRYIGKISGPILDRFDLRVVVRRPAVDDLFDADPGESTVEVAARVALARRRAIERGGVLNAELDEVGLNDHARLTPQAEDTLRAEMERGRLTARGMHRIRRVARTLADLAGDSDVIADDHVVAALGMRTRVGHSSVRQAA
jgi:magnesium chelatase family protein